MKDFGSCVLCAWFIDVLLYTLSYPLVLKTAKLHLDSGYYMSQIRLNKTPELEEVLAYLKSKYRVLSEAEIIKVALAEQYKKEMKDIPLVDEET